MMMAAALGFKKRQLPWRLLDAILAHERDKLGVKIIKDEWMLELYAANGEQAGSERTLRRDKDALWRAQANVGVELVWYAQGYETEDGQRFACRYKSNLDRWALEAIYKALRQNRRGKFYYKSKELKEACETIAKDIPRCPFDYEAKKKKKKEIDPEILGERIQLKAEKSLEHITTRFHEAWDTQGLSLLKSDR